MKLETLTEKLREIDEDVEYIYSKGFKEFFTLLHKSPSKNLTKLLELLNSNITFYSSELPSIESKNASSLNDVKIVCNVLKNPSNFYNPSGRVIVLNNSADIHGLLEHFGSQADTVEDFIAILFDNFARDSVKDFIPKLYPNRMKETIRHELAHWMDDSFNNRHLYKKQSRFPASDYENDDDADRAFANSMDRRVDDMMFTTAEVEGQVHEIAQHKKVFTDEEWDALTFEQLWDTIPRFKNSFNELKDLRGFALWKRRLLSRLSREGLIGKNMR